MKYFLVPFGCQMNLSDSERVRQIIESMGYSPAEREEDAQLLGIIACSVRQKAIDRVYSRIHTWNLRKRQENLLTFVSGCILDNDQGKFLKLFDLVFRMQELHKLPDLIRTSGISTPFNHGSHHGNHQDQIHMPGSITADPEEQKSLWDIEPHYSSNFEAYVPIQNGCDKFCTFCAVPYTRGREISRPAADILEEVQGLLEKGYATITLLGQNVNSYGLDKKTSPSQVDFPNLLESIARVAQEISDRDKRRIWIYFTSPHPRDMNEKLIKVLASYPVLARQIHLPLQSGDDAVLQRMNRKHGIAEYRAIVRKIREHIPDVALFTDIIVGFSGESDEQFEHTREALSEFGYAMAFIAQYSPRPGAVSATWEDDVRPEVKKERFEILSKTLKQTASAHNQKLVGRRIPVLITGKDRKPGFYTARTEGRINIRIPEDQPDLIGRIVDVDVQKNNGLTLFGQLPDQAAPEPEKSSIAAGDDIQEQQA